MLTTEIDDLLTLLAIIIFADQRVFAQEIDTFMKEARELQIAREIEPRLTEARLLTWFEMHRDDLKAQIDATDYAAWLGRLLDRLSPLPDKTLILDVMYKIAISDGEMHKSEKYLIAFSAQRWNIKYHPPALSA